MLTYEKSDHVLPSFQIIGRFGKFRYIIFTMYIDIMFIEVHGKNYVFRFDKTILNLKRYTIWNGGNSSISQKKTEQFFSLRIVQELVQEKEKVHVDHP